MAPQNPRRISNGVAVFLAVLLWIPISAEPCHGVVAVIQIDHSQPEDITRAVSVLMSPDGRIAFDRRTRSLIVNDTPKVVARVRDLVRRLDQPPVPLTIRVRLGTRQRLDFA